MQLAPIDLGIIAASIILSFLPALFFYKRAGTNTTEFFTSGRAAPWWLVGVSMVATTFSTDTPNFVTDIVRQKGVAQNWMWWSFLLTGMLTVFFFARLWRRSEVVTDLEFYERRYSGNAATFVRGFRAIYLGLFFNCVIMGTVNLAAVKIANVVLGWPAWQTLLVCSIMTIFFASISGLWGVLVTDSLQFVITMSGTFVLAFYALQHPAVGGLDGLITRVDPKLLNVMPDFSDWSTALAIFIIPITVQWWSVWYPGAEPGGGSYIAQRMLASKTENDALGGTLLFNVMHYALRPWPWIIVALCSTLVYPTLESIKSAFPNADPKLIGNDIAYPAMLSLLPAGALGFLLAGMLASYRSTIETHLNWGTSYLVHDFYRRFVKRDATEGHYVLAGRITTALLMVVAALLTFVLDTAAESFNLILKIGAGTGLIYILRWFWWRINAWSEVAAMASSFIVSIGFFIAGKNGLTLPDHQSLIYTVVISTVCWVAVTYMTAPTDRATLVDFYKRVRPAGPGWTSVRAEAGVGPSPDSMTVALGGWVLGCVFVYSALFGTGSFLYGKTSIALVWLGVFVVSGLGLIAIFRAGMTKPTA
ncbi:MAG TPA: sodium:solute symporter family protein [Gemmatimonas sp.]|nr:sodium:solute symporter family protein [Gemmatimonas sp.]